MGLTKISQFTESRIYLLSRFMGIIAICVLVVMMLFTVLNVIMRAFFNSPIPGDVELTEVGMVGVGFLGLAWCAMKGMHIRVDLVVSFLPKRLQAIIDSFGYLIGLGITVLLAWRGFVEGQGYRALKNLSASLGFPIYPFYWIVAVGYGALCLAILVLLARSLSEAIRK